MTRLTSKLHWRDLLAILFILISVLIRVTVEPKLTRYVGIDSYFYDETAVHLALGQGYSQETGNGLRPVFGVTPGYSLFLATLYRFLPLEEPLSDNAQRVLVVVGVQNILSIITNLILYWVISRRFKRPDVGLVFLGIVAFYIPYVIASYKIGVETLALFVFSLIIGLTFTKHFSTTFLGQATIGLTSGYLVLIKPYFIYILPTIILWKWVLRPKQRRFMLRQAGVMFFFMAFVLTVWVARTYLTNKMFIPIQAGIRWVQETGSCPDELCSEAPETTASALSANEEDEKYVIEVERNYFMVSDNPYLKTLWWYLIKKPRDHLGETFDRGGLNKIGSVPLRDQLALAIERYHVWLMMLSLVGAVLIIRRKESNWKLLVYWNLFGIITHTAFWVLPRYALAMVLLMLVTASFALVEMGNIFFRKETYKQILCKWHQSSRLWKTAWLLLVALLALQLAWISGFKGVGLDGRRLISILFWLDGLILMFRYLLPQPYVSRFQWGLRILVILFIWSRLIAYWPRFWAVTTTSFALESQVFPVVLRNGKVLLN